MRNSLILKSMVFRCVASFLPLFVFTFRERDFTLLSRNVSSAMITASILNVIVFNVQPWIMYLIKKFLFYRSWTPYITERRQANYKKHFGREEIPSPSDDEKCLKLSEFNALPADIQESYIAGNYGR